MNEVEPNRPEYPDWMIKEAQGDAKLLDLLENIEWLSKERAEAGGATAPNADEYDKALKSFRDEANQRKRELGILPPEEE